MKNSKVEVRERRVHERRAEIGPRCRRDRSLLLVSLLLPLLAITPSQASVTLIFQVRSDYSPGEDFTIARTYVYKIDDVFLQHLEETPAIASDD